MDTPSKHDPRRKNSIDFQSLKEVEVKQGEDDGQGDAMEERRGSHRAARGHTRRRKFPKRARSDANLTVNSFMTSQYETSTDATISHMSSPPSNYSNRNNHSSSRFGSPDAVPVPGKLKIDWHFIWLMTISYLKNYIPPPFTWVPEYKLIWMPFDVLAGISTGVLLLPQAMAYATLAGLDPVYGFYAALTPSIVYILLGPNQTIVLGPTSVLSLLVGTAIAEQKGVNPALAATTLSFFMGIGYLLLGFLRVGFLATLISKPIVIGFTAAAAILIDSTQIRYLFGLNMKSNSSIVEFFEFFIAALKTQKVNGWDILIGLLSIAFIIGLKLYHRTKLVPGPVIVVITTILITWGFRLDEKANIKIVGAVPKGLPTPQLPLLPAREIAAIGPQIVVVASIALVELISISKVFSVKAGKIMNTNMELVAVGAAALIGSFFKAYPATGSFTRTALNDTCRAKSQLSNVVAMILLIIILLAATTLLKYLPFTVLAAIVISSTISLFEFEEAKFIWYTQKRDFLIMAASFVLTLLLGPEYGVVVSVCINIFFILWDQSRMKTRELGQLPKHIPSALFDAVHPDIPAEQLANDPSDALFVVKRDFPDAIDHPHLLIIRPADTITYVNVDDWFMSVINWARPKLVANFKIEETQEMQEMNDLMLMESRDEVPSSFFSSSSSVGQLDLARSFIDADGNYINSARDASATDSELVENESNRHEIIEYAAKTKDLIGFVIIDMIHINYIDSTVVGRFADLHKTLRAMKIGLAIARPRSNILHFLVRGNVVHLIGQDFVIDSVHIAVIRCNAVLKAARKFQVLKLRFSMDLPNRDSSLTGSTTNNNNEDGDENEIGYGDNAQEMTKVTYGGTQNPAQGV